MTKIRAPWLAAPAVQRAFDLFKSAGHDLYVVGGCVRNTLLNQPVSDIDMASPARPDEVLDLAKEDNLRAIPTGIDHGTVTLVVDDMTFEVTTFRDDVETDGRHAIVQFSNRLETDAQRRDFTMNALYADREGNVVDVVGGLDDIAHRRVRFVGDAARRLQEDYLRALRYFRFLAWYGDPDHGADPEALAAIAAHLDGLRQLSQERVTQEVLKLLAAPDPAPALATMQHIGVLQALFDGGDARALARLTHIEAQLKLPADPVVRLASLNLPRPAASLRLSRAQDKLLAQLTSGVSDLSAPAVLGYRLGAKTARQVCALRAALFEVPPNPGDVTEIDRGAGAVFPVTAADLMPEFQGAALGAALARLESAWIASDFTLSQATLLAQRRGS